MFRTTSLFHYTKSAEVIQSILSKGFIPNFCSESIPLSRCDLTIGVPQVSFCDIPVLQTDKFRERYGNFAIGISKDWAEIGKLNPVFYVNCDNVKSSLGFFTAIERLYRSKVEKRGNNMKTYRVNLLDKEQVSGIADFINGNLSHDANMNLFGYIKPMYISREGGNQCNYEENEWRYVLEESNKVVWHWSREEYDGWRGNGEKPSEFEDKALKFGVEDVTHILVESDEHVKGMVEYINNLSSLCGIASLTDIQRSILLTRINTFSRIASDF